MPTSLSQKQLQSLTELAAQTLELRAQAVREGAFDVTLKQLAVLLSEADNDMDTLRQRVIPGFKRQLEAAQRASLAYRRANLERDEVCHELITQSFALLAEAEQVGARAQRDKASHQAKLHKLMELGASLEEAQRIAGPFPESPDSKESLLAESKALVDQATALRHQKAAQAANPYSVEAGWVRGYGVFSGLDVTEQLPSPKPHC